MGVVLFKVGAVLFTVGVVRFAGPGDGGRFLRAEPAAVRSDLRTVGRVRSVHVRKVRNNFSWCPYPLSRTESNCL